MVFLNIINSICCMVVRYRRNNPYCFFKFLGERKLMYLYLIWKNINCKNFFLRTTWKFYWFFRHEISTIDFISPVTGMLISYALWLLCTYTFYSNNLLLHFYSAVSWQKQAGTCDNIWIISFVVSTIFQGGIGKNGMECGGCISSNIPCRVGCFWVKKNDKIKYL